MDGTAGLAASPWALLESVGDGVAVTHFDGRLIYASAALAQLLGHTALRADSPIFAWLEPAAHAPLRAALRALESTGASRRASISGPEGIWQAEVVLKAAAAGTERVAVWSFTRALERAGRVPDRADPRGASVAQGTDFGFWELDVATDTIHWWSDWCETLNIDPCAGAGHTPRWNLITHPDDLAGSQVYDDVLAGHGDEYQFEYRVRTRAGDWHWVITRGRVTRRDGSGRALHIDGVIIDIDARKRAEEALHASERHFEAAVWGTEVGVWETDGEGRSRWLNDWCEGLDLDPCDGANQIHRWRSCVHPDDVARYAELKDGCATGGAGHYVVEYRIRTRGGQWRWLHERGKVLERDAAGRAQTYVGICFDIDARKQMEAALRAAEERYEAAVNAAQLPVWELDVPTDVVRGNVYWHRAVGYELTEEEARRRTETWLSDVHPDDVPRLGPVPTDPKTQDAPFFEQEFRVMTPAGRYKWLFGRGQVTLRDAHGKPLKMAGIALDIDARKRMEIALRAQALILETMREGVVLIDESGRIEFTNPAFNRMFGRESADLCGTQAWDLLNSRVRGKSQRHALERLIRRASLRGGRRTILLRRAERAPLAAEVLSGTIELNGERKILCVLQDISERRRLEQEISEIAYLERRRLGSDLHDGLGQELTGIALLLRSLAQTGNSAARPMAPHLDEIIGLVNHAIHSARQLASGLSPVTLTHGGLIAALQSLADWSRTNYGIAVRLRLGLRCALAIDESSATHLYLIAQEAVANAVKHGRATAVTVTLRVNHLFFSLSVADDGAGFEPGIPGSGTGIKIMHYRAGAIGGSLQIKRRRNGGTRVHCVCAHAPASVDPGARPSRQGGKPTGAEFNL